MVKYFGLLFFLVFNQFCLAQGNVGEIKDAEIIIEKNRKIEFPVIQRNFEKNTYSLLPLSKPAQLNYRFEDFSSIFKPYQPKINAIAMPEQEATKLYTTHIRAGVGNLLTSYLEASHHSARTKGFAYGLHGRHLASVRGPYKDAGQNENILKAWSSYYTKNFVLTGEALYERLGYNYYGYDRRFEYAQQARKQNYQTTGVALSLGQPNDSSKFVHRHNLSFYNLKDRFENSEFRFLLSADYGYKPDSNSSFHAQPQVLLSRYTTLSNPISRNLLNLPIYYKRGYKGWQIQAGATVSASNDTISNSKSVHFYPLLRLAKRFGQSKYEAYIKIDGRLEPNTYSSLILENPFLGSALPLAHTNKKIAYEAGTIAQLGRGSQAALSINYARLDNLPFFLNDIQDSTRFGIIYDGGASGRLVSRLDFQLQASTSSRLFFNLCHQAFYTDTLAHAWHRPSVLVSGGYEYNFANKIYIYAKVSYRNAIFARAIDGRQIKLSGITDLAAGIEYKFSDRFSAFIKADNLLNIKAQPFLNYRYRGVLAIIGLSATF